jgi:hypothetical protein
LIRAAAHGDGERADQAITFAVVRDAHVADVRPEAILEARERHVHGVSMA